MRHGRKETIFTTILRTLVAKAMHPSFYQTPDKSYHAWQTLIPVFNSTLLAREATYSSFNCRKWRVKSPKHTLVAGHLLRPKPLLVSTLLVSELESYKPTFIFKVQKVDKSTRKNSRGKSGKYVTLWKYVPAYKRLYTVLRWLIQDTVFQKARKFELKFWQALNLILSSSKSSLIKKFRNFNHNFVFKNFKKTLLQSLNTVS